MTRREKLEKILREMLESGGYSQEKCINEIEKLFKQKEIPTFTPEDEMKFGFLFTTFSTSIYPVRKLTDKAKRNMYLRLKDFTPSECAKAIENFAADEWNMKHNGHRSLEWFFDKHERIDTYLRMVPKEVEGETIKIGDKIYKSEAEIIEAERIGEIYYDDRKAQFVSRGKVA